MFKSTFVKYLITFILIILISFLLLSGIITSMIRSYATDEKEKRLYNATSSIAEEINRTSVEELETFIESGVYSYLIIPVINFDVEIDVIISDKNGTVLASTLGASPDDNGMRIPITGGGLGEIEIKDTFREAESEQGSRYFIHRGTLNGFLGESSVVYAKEIITGGEVRGYVISFYSTVKDDNLIEITRKTVINSSAWVMLAAVIAIYFITERIIRPLKNMTVAAKSFEGKFETRVSVYGNDEVAALGNAFNNMAESLQNLEKMRSSFLASVSHDLRTPMTTIAGFIDGIMSGAIPPDKQEYYLKIISSEVHRLSRLVSQLLDISRLESGDRKMNFDSFDVAEVARIVLISFEKKIEEKNLDVSFIADDENPMLVYADKDAIHQVLYNLCHNAIKFSRDGGKLEIKISDADPKEMHISVYDEGQSISDEEAQRIFERFYKTDQSRGLDKSGVGLGLYICKTIIDAHGEKISVKSVEDQSCEFTFTLKRPKSQKG